VVISGRLEKWRIRERRRDQIPAERAMLFFSFCMIGSFL